jgi:hypothetical protein
MNETTIDSLDLRLQGELDDIRVRRIAAAMDFLVGLIKRAFNDKLTQNRGAAGSVGSIDDTVTRAADYVEAIIGVGASGKYLANLDQGEQGLKGGSGKFKRTKMPPIKNIYQWIRANSISVPAGIVRWAERNRKIASGQLKQPKTYDPTKPWWTGDSEELFAFSIAKKRRDYGYAALGIIEKTINDHIDKVTAYIEGTATT